MIPSVPPPVVVRDGDYVFTSGTDNPLVRDEAERVLRTNGCRSFRHEPLTDGRLITHGYLTH